jgi:hypothetical protein
MIFLRILAALLAVVKLLFGSFLIVIAWSQAVHAFGVAYRPPDWRPVHVFVILAGIGLAYPHSLFPSRKILGLIFIALPAVSMFATIDEPRNDISSYCVIAFLLSAGEWILQRFAFPERAKRPTRNIGDPRAGHSERASYSERGEESRRPLRTSAGHPAEQTHKPRRRKASGESNQ